MDYYINPAAFSAVFTVPSEVVDRYLKLASGEHIKVLLYILRNMSDMPDVAGICEATGVKEYDVKEALIYWAGCGILLSKQEPVAAVSKKEKAVIRREKPCRADIARRGAEDDKICYLLREAQLKFGRNLKTNETSTLVWLYDDLGLDISLVLMVVQYAVSQNRCNIGFIEKIAVDWVNRGIDTVAKAEEELNQSAIRQQAWNIVQKAFGIERRMPSTKELEYSAKWINEWGISGEMLRFAYETCVDAKSKFSFPYVAKILESWYQKGYKKPEDVLKEQKNAGRGKTDHSAFDIELFEKMLNSDD